MELSHKVFISIPAFREEGDVPHFKSSLYHFISIPAFREEGDDWLIPYEDENIDFNPRLP